MESRIKALAQANNLPTDKIEQAEQLLGFDPISGGTDTHIMEGRIKAIRDERDMAKTNALILCITADYALRKAYAHDNPKWDEFMLAFDYVFMEFLHIPLERATIERIWH